MNKQLQIGKPISVKTTLSDQIEGLFYSYDEVDNYLILCSPTEQHANQMNFRIINKEYLAETKIFEQEKQEILFDPYEIDWQQHSKNEQRMIEAARQEMKYNNKEAGEVAQKIFKELAKQYTCEWSQTDIVINQLSVKVADPYTENSVMSLETNGENKAVTRIANILKNIRAKLNLDSQFN